MTISDSSFDVFLSYNSLDKELAHNLKLVIKKMGLRAWLDVDGIRPGLPWQPILNQAVVEAPSIAVLVGPSGIGPWEDEEIQAAISAAVKDKRPVFAVIYTDNGATAKLPVWLSNRGRIIINREVSEENAYMLYWAITGVKKSNSHHFRPNISKRKNDTNDEVKDPKEFAIAEHAINLFLGKDGSINNNEIFPNIASVTKYVKAIVTATKSRQMETIVAIKRVYPSATHEEKNQLAYLLGRLEDHSCRNEAANLLIEYLDDLDGEQTFTSSKEVLLLIRTIYISLVYLGRYEYAERYCDKLLTDSTWDSINRGFHLQYYGDLTKPQGMATADDLSVTPVNTMSNLLDRLQDDLVKGTFRPVSRIEVHTLVSLLVSRHVHGKLSDIVRARVIPLLNETLLSHQKEFAGGLGAYIGFARDILAHKSISVAEIFEEFYRLKRITRQGWVHRNIPTPESVADHTFGCMLIALAFLPENIEADPTYSKDTVIKMLLLHDLSEGFFSDIPSKKGDDITEIGVISGRAHVLSSMGVDGLSTWSELFKSYIEHSCVNSKLHVIWIHWTPTYSLRHTRHCLTSIF